MVYKWDCTNSRDVSSSRKMGENAVKGFYSHECGLYIIQNVLAAENRKRSNMKPFKTLAQNVF